MTLEDEGLELLDEDQCRWLLASGSLGRVAVSIGALPAILPVNYCLIDGAIVFRTGEGTKLGAAVANNVVAFEVEGGLDKDYREGWSVLVVGRAEVVTDPGELSGLAGRAPRPWADGTRDHVVRVTVDFVSGRRIRHAHHAHSGGR